MPTPNVVEDMIAKAMLEVMIDVCITQVARDDKSRASVCIIGKPTNELAKKIVVSVHTVHPLGPPKDMEDLMMGTPTKPNERPYKFPAETIGGMTTRKMIGTVQINLREGVKAPDAIVLIGALESRIRNGIDRDPRLKVFHDDFKNTAYLIRTFQAYGYASGGGSTSLHRRWIDWMATVSSPNWREGDLQ